MALSLNTSAVLTASSGYIYDWLPRIRVLNDLTDVIITSPTNGQKLKYDGTYWRNAAP